ncbi:synaptotagmin-10-like [Heterocephalus glaber]|uniref:Synaptotagmin-10-like n=1 Tax=Heterocephalus glaber TaxID=10181 RepID=A0AAX6NSG1_HETGA|nr:synaptotagmin-10-like [Heterocephalus glaber]
MTNPRQDSHFHEPLNPLINSTPWLAGINVPPSIQTRGLGAEAGPARAPKVAAPERTGTADGEEARGRRAEPTENFHKEDRVSSLCQKALHIVTELCFSGQVEWEKCSGIFPLESGSRAKGSTDIFFSLLAVISFCGLALLVVSLFVFWKWCWPCWKSKAVTPNVSILPQSISRAPTEVFEAEEKKEVKENGKPALKALEPAIKISHTSDIPAEVQTALKVHLIKHAHVQRQTTEPTSSSRHNSFRRQMQVSSVDFTMDVEPVLQRGETTTSIGRIKPELYKQKSVDSEGNRTENVKTCGKLNFTLQYDYENELLVVKIIKALDLPEKDFTGTSGPHVKTYLLPDRKKKFQTHVHRKTLNPLFDEAFQFPVVYDQLSNRKLHFSVYDFDRFSRHDMIGEVILDNLFEVSDLSREATVWKDIHCATTESIDLGEIMFSLCYLPAAGHMILTVIKCRNLKAMDITGSSDLYVKVSLICEGRRLKKRKTAIKKNTLNPVYNEAIIFDIPLENMDQVSLTIAVMDYDRVRHNGIIGVCGRGLDAEGLGHNCWNEMLAYHRKAITLWHPCWRSYGIHMCLELPGRATSFDSQGSCSSPKPPSTP